MPFVESGGFVVVVIGATGAVGEDLSRALALSALPIRELSARLEPARDLCRAWRSTARTCRSPS
jgi:hypothetical protein